MPSTVQVQTVKEESEAIVRQVSHQDEEEQPFQISPCLCQVLQNAEFANIQRDLDVVELWSGVESIVTAARNKGLKAEPFDKNRKPGVTTFSEDICSDRLILR